MDFPTIIDNQSEETSLSTVLSRAILPYTARMQVAVGYFYYSGFQLLAPALRQNPLFSLFQAPPHSLRVIMSPRTDRTTADLLSRGLDLQKGLLHSVLARIEEDVAAGDVEHSDFFLELLKREILDVRLYTEDFFHAKAYLAQVSLPNGEHYYSIVGSSNFSASGFTDNRELNLTNSGSLHYRYLLQWFDKIWDGATVGLSPHLIRIVESERKSRQRNLSSEVALSPFDLYLFLTQHYLGALTRERLDRADMLAEFQQVGAENILSKLEILGGAIVSDSVGLGKTFTAGEVIRRLRAADARVLIVVPPTLLPQWKETLSESFGIPESQYVQFLSQGKLSQVATEQVHTLKGGQEFDLIVVDEAHRARNAQTRLYQNLKALQPQTTERRAHVLLLTATPFNNSIRDLQNLVDLCTTQARLYAAGFTPNAFDRFAERSRDLRRDGGVAIQTDGDFQKAMTEIHAILGGVMLLRMRSSIKKKYKDISIAGKPLVFYDPEVRRLAYAYSEKHHDLFENLSGFLTELHLPHIKLSNPESGSTLSGLFVLFLFKRIESSLYAFYMSLMNIKERERELQAAIHSGNDLSELLKAYNRAWLQREPIEEEPELFDAAPPTEPDAEAAAPEPALGFTMEDVRGWIAEDTRRIDTFVGTYLHPLMTDVNDPLTLADPKLSVYLSALGRERFRKCMTFTEYRDTARYITHHVGAEVEVRSAMVTAGDAGLKEKLGRFAPRGQRMEVRPEDELDLLIATDVLAEGVNLQDADLLVNFDLPWNPMRIVQRVGRVNRIGSENRVMVLNMTPSDKVLSQFLGLVEILTAKVKQVAMLLGKEMAILSSEDEVIDIKEIGVELQNVRNAQTVDALEGLAHKSRIFMNMEGETEEDHFRASLQFSALKHQIRPEDFVQRSGSRTYYTVLSPEPRQAFALFEIYGKRREHRDLLSRHWLAVESSGHGVRDQEGSAFPYAFIQTRHAVGSVPLFQKTVALEPLDQAIQERCLKLLSERRERFKPGAVGSKLKHIKARIQADLLIVLSKLQKEADLPGVESFAQVARSLPGFDPAIVPEIADVMARHPFAQSQLTYLRRGLQKVGLGLDRGISPPQYRDFAGVLLDFYNKHIISDPGLRGSIYKQQEIEGRQILVIYA
ncbi:MAG: DEAD/DEAH box helicase family protein [Spirochaetales bacterium]|nr:DEAD/DEAH box helicase family protein [Spirochaetales bacterium]